MKKTRSILVRLLSAITFLTLSVSCSDTDTGPDPNPNPNSTPTIDYAPKDVVGKEFRFYKDGAEKYSFKAVAAANPSDAKISTGTSQYVVISSPFFHYDKTDINRAEVLCSFFYSILGVVGDDMIFDYELELTFLSENYGTYEGKLTHFDSMDDWTSVKGVFVFDSEKEPDELAAEVEDSENDHTKITWSNLTSSTWLCEEYGYDVYMVFNDNGTFKQSLDYASGKITSIDGTYKIDKIKNEISQYTDGTLFVKYKVEQLTQNTLKITSATPDGDYPPEQSRTYNATDKEFPDSPQTTKLTISAPIISDITETSAIIQGTIYGEGVTFQERGVCYSTKENPTISNDVICVNTDNVNVSLSNLYKGTPYYVRLYAMINGQITYGEQISFTTAGTFESNIKLFATKIGLYELHIEVTLPDNIKEYGLCYGKSPNPLITDNATAEVNNETITWALDDLTPGAEYYIRAYHIEDSKVVYYEDSEIQVSTLGKDNIDARLSYNSNSVYYGGYDSSISYIAFGIIYNLPKGTYEAKVSWSNRYGASYRASKYVSGDDTWVAFDEFEGAYSYGLMLNNSYTLVAFKSLDTGAVYYRIYRLVIDSNSKTINYEDVEAPGFDIFGLFGY